MLGSDETRRTGTVAPRVVGEARQQAIEALRVAGFMVGPDSSVTVLRVETAHGLVMLVTVGTPPLDAAKLRDWFGLTPRESEVALLLMERRTNKEIGMRLNIKQRSAWYHTERVLAKLGAGSRRNVLRVVQERHQKEVG